jgi:hypothetical protein
MAAATIEAAKTRARGSAVGPEAHEAVMASAPDAALAALAGPGAAGHLGRAADRRFGAAM